MRVHFQQLTEPIAAALDHDLFEFALRSFRFPIQTQLKSPAPRSRRLQGSAWRVSPRACGDPSIDSVTA
jgi:hypothetical protein